mgnify:CR=1 FL=1|jgi:hypothetical protein
MKAPEEKKKIIKRARSRVIIAVVASLTLGLAPFFPEPHLFGKWKWLIGGAEGMQPMDWFDLALHTSPWIYLSMSILFLVNLGKKVSKGLEVQD